MSLTHINFKITNTTIPDPLKNVTESKLRTLEKYIGESPTICDVEFERITNHHQQGNINRVEVNLEINGKLFRAEATSDSFEKAIDNVREELQQTLDSHRGKQDTLLRRGARKMKHLMRFGR